MLVSACVVAAQLLVMVRVMDTDAWFRELSRLLRGRYPLNHQRGGDLR
jgi:hypothetical protein